MGFITDILLETVDVNKTSELQWFSINLSHNTDDYFVRDLQAESTL